MKASLSKIIALSLALGMTAGFATFPKELVVLGDSLSDSGNSRAVLGFFELPPSSFPYPRFCPISDGVTWPVLLSQQLNTEKNLTPYARGGTNYAYVAAETVDSSLFFPVNPSITEQVGLIPSSVNRKNPAFVFGGANDIYAYNSITNPNPGYNAAVNLGAILTSLHDLGFKYLVILNMPDIGATPSVLGTTNAPIYTVQAGELNRELQNQLSNIGFPVLEVDIFTLFNNILQNYQQYGFSSVTSSPSPLPYPIPGGQSTAGFAFWYDGTHFTEATHQLISDYIFSILSGAGCYATMAETPFAILREQAAGIRQELFPNQPRRKPGSCYFFANGTYTPLAVPALSDTCSDNTLHGGNFSVGMLGQIDDSWNLGVAGEASWNQYHCHTDSTRCGYDLNAYTLSIFGGWMTAPAEQKKESSKPSEKKSPPPAQFHQSAYVNAIINVAFLDFNKIKRKFSVGPVSQESVSDTTGMDYYGFLYGAYYLPTSNQRINTGPLATLEYQFATVNGYTEYDLNYGNLVFKNQNNSSVSTGIGWEVRFEYPAWIGDLFLSVNRQWLGTTRRIHFREKSMPANYGTWPAEMPQTTFISGGLAFSIFCKDSAQLNIGYQFNSGISEVPMREQFLTLNLSI